VNRKLYIRSLFAINMVQYDMFEEEPSRLYDLQQQLIMEALFEKNKKLFTQSRTDVVKFTKELSIYVEQVDKKLSEVSGSHPFYFIMAEGIKFCQPIFLRAKEFINSPESASKEDYTYLLFDLSILEARSRTIDYFIQNVNHEI